MSTFCTTQYYLQQNNFEYLKQTANKYNLKEPFSNILLFKLQIEVKYCPGIYVEHYPIGYSRCFNPLIPKSVITWSIFSQLIFFGPKIVWDLSAL